METTFQYLSVVSSFFPIAVGFIFLRLQTRISILILVLCLFCLGCDILSYVWALTYGNNYWVIHLYHNMLVLILGFFYFTFLNRREHLFPWPIFIIIYAIDLLLISGPAQINSLLVSMECLIFIVYGVLGYLYMFNQQEHLFIDKYPEFWFNTGIICYFSGALFSWAMFHFLHQSDGSGAGIWIFHNVANILKNILFAIGLWKVRATA